MSAAHVAWELFGTQAWGTGGNILAAGILGVPAYVLRGPLGRSLAKHIAPHVAAHLQHQTSAPCAPDAAGATPATAPPGGLPPTPHLAPPPAPHLPQKEVN
jgi:hypothetical protein